MNGRNMCMYNGALRKLRIITRGGEYEGIGRRCCCMTSPAGCLEQTKVQLPPLWRPCATQQTSVTTHVYTSQLANTYTNPGFINRLFQTSKWRFRACLHNPCFEQIIPVIYEVWKSPLLVYIRSGLQWNLTLLGTSIWHTLDEKRRGILIRLLD